MKFFFWADRESDRLAPLYESAARHAISPEAIGVDYPIAGSFHCTLFKQRSLYDAVKRLDPGEIVCATDGFDVFFQQGPDYVRQQFLTFGRDVVFSAERGYSHQYRRFKEFFDRRADGSPYKYLNAGGVVGYAGALRRLYRPGTLLGLRLKLVRRRYLRRLLVRVTGALQRRLGPPAKPCQDPVIYLKWFDYTDQAQMARYLARGRRRVSIDLDRGCKLFWCTAFEWDDIDSHYQLVAGKLQNRHTAEIPACVHVPWEARYRPVLLKLFELVHGSKGTSRPTPVG